VRARGTGGGWPAHGALPAGRRPPRLAHRPSSVPRGTLTHHQRTGRRPDLPTSGRSLSPCRPPSTAAGDTSGRGESMGNRGMIKRLARAGLRHDQRIKSKLRPPYYNLSGGCGLVQQVVKCSIYYNNLSCGCGLVQQVIKCSI
jgi:hypothetical protein